MFTGFIKGLHGIREGYHNLSARRLTEKNNLQGLDPDRISLFWWYPGFLNFGDALSPIIVQALSGRALAYPLNDSSRVSSLIAIGSCLHTAHDGDLIWGAGLKGEDYPIKIKQLDIRAVRGPLTRNYLVKQGIDCPSVYGDPAVLLPYLFQPQLSKFKYKVGVIKHFNDRTDWSKFKESGIQLINPKGNPLRVIGQICSCEVILSSSLHGLIVAEAYGIPACWLCPEKILWAQQPEPIFKYHDYFYSTLREPSAYSYCKDDLDIEKAVRVAYSSVKPVFDHQRLLISFPFLRPGITCMDDLKGIARGFQGNSQGR